MRRLALALFFLAACARETPAPPPPVAEQAANPTWFICDAVNAPTLVQVERNDREIRVSEFDKPNGAIVSRTDFTLGADDAAAGSVFSALLIDGREAGAIRQTNPGMLETPGSAYTPRITEVRLGERTIDCRWLPRTRLFGFTGRRSFVVHEDADGDLIYTTFDFTAASAAPRIDLSENGVSTTFSVEVRGGEEQISPEGASYVFAGADGFSYAIAVTGATGALEVRRDGAAVQSEPVIGFQTGDAAE